MSSSLAVVVVPIRRSGKYINTLLASLAKQDYRHFKVIIVGNVDEPTWKDVDPRYQHDPRFRFLEAEVPANWPGRDSNIKRNHGALAGVEMGAKYLFFTDAKIQHNSDWLSSGIRLMSQHGVDAVGGIMISTSENSGSFWADFTDKALLKRNPEFGEGYILTADNFGKYESLPITACMGVRTAMYVQTPGFPEVFVDSYEDYSFDWVMAKNGAQIYCSDTWTVYHEHRSAFSAILLEYVRSGRGAAQLYRTFPECPYGQRRARQVYAVLSVLLTGVLIFGLTVAFHLWMATALLSAGGSVAFLAAGVANVVKARSWKALFFPPLTAYFIFIFSIAFMRKLVEIKLNWSRSHIFLQTTLNMFR